MEKNNNVNNRQKNPWEEDPWDKTYPYQYFKYEVDKKEKIATVTMSNPSGKDVAPWFACYQGVKLIDQWERDDDVKVVIIKGDGKDFCNGHDFGAYLAATGMRNESREAAASAGRKYRRTNRQTILLQRDEVFFYTRLLYSLKPTICQVHGNCIEWGNLIQSLTDITIASEDAHFGNLGQVVGTSGTLFFNRYSHLIGQKRTREMAVSGRTMNGKEAESRNLINRAVPRNELDAEVRNEAKRIAVIPLDGLVTGKAYTQLTMESQGVGFDILLSGYMWSGFALNIKYEPGDFKFFDVLREQSLGEAIRARKKIYEPLGGFGPAAERF
jgi:enoyl-CoA hydratase